MNNFAQEKENTLKLISQSNKIAIIPSSPIDGDALGSSLGLNLILQKMGKISCVYYSFDRFSFFKFLPSSDKIVVKDLFELDFSQFDLVIFVDGGNLKQFYDQKIHPEPFKIPQGSTTLNIDHHGTNENFAQHLILDREASSTCELIYRLFHDKVDLDKDIATCLYTGISTDTGRFINVNTSATAMEVAAKLLAFGVEVGKLTLHLEYSVPRKVVQYVCELFPMTYFDEEFRYAFLVIPLNHWAGKVSYEEMKQAVSIVRDDLLRTIIGVDFVIVGKEEDSGYIDLSMRTRVPNVVDLRILGGFFGGGGHVNAGGGVVKGLGIEQTIDLVKKTIREKYLQIKI